MLSQADVTHLLNAYGEGDREALDRLMPVVYEHEVRSITIMPRPSTTMGGQCAPLSSCSTEGFGTPDLIEARALVDVGT